MPVKKKPGPEPMELLSRTRTTGISLRPYHRYVLSHAEASISDTIQFLIEKTAQEESLISEEDFKKRDDAMQYAKGHMPTNISLRHAEKSTPQGWGLLVQKGHPVMVIDPSGKHISLSRLTENPGKYVQEYEDSVRRIDTTTFRGAEPRHIYIDEDALKEMERALDDGMDRRYIKTEPF